MTFFLGCAMTAPTIKAYQPDELCKRMAKCSEVVRVSPEQLTRANETCLKVATENVGHKQDMWVVDCDGLPPCAFAVCMEAHMDARYLSKQRTQGL